jgi:hypothetical protein
MKKIAITAILCFVLGLVSTSCENSKKEGDVEKQEITKHDDNEKADALHEHSDEVAMANYQCPMKCEGDKTYNEKGSCPVCKMDIKEIESEKESESAEKASE